MSGLPPDPGAPGAFPSDHGAGSYLDRPGRDHWFEELADHLGSAYLRYSFTRGTENEVDFLVGCLGLEPGDHVLDVGCGPGRHAHALGRRGILVTGVDISERFVELARTDAPEGVTFERMDARTLPFDGEFDAAISLCQGAFGLAGKTAGSGPDPMTSTRPVAVGETAPPPGNPSLVDIEPVLHVATGLVDPDGAVLAGMAQSIRPGARLAISAFSAYFQVRYLEDSDTFDVDAGVNHERTVLRSEIGVDKEHDLWTSCFTPRELRLLAAAAGLGVEAMWSVTPGSYRPDAPDLDHPELLMIARRP